MPALPTPGEEEIRAIVDGALRRLVDVDAYLFSTNNSERCLSARLAHHLQLELPGWAVDVEYSRAGTRLHPKRLQLDEDCGNRRDLDGRVYVVPDLIVHQRGPDGPNLFVAELKKSTNTSLRYCDQHRIERFRAEFKYLFGAVIELETKEGSAPGARIARWFNE